MRCCRSHVGEPAGQTPENPSSERSTPPLHHILHWTKLPYQQQDLKAVQDDTTSALWHTIKRCQTWFLLHCFGLGCQRIKHYLKEDLFRREKGTVQVHWQWRGDSVSSGHVGRWGAQKKKGNTIRKRLMVGVAVGGSNFPVWLSPGNLGDKTLKLHHTGIKFSRSFSMAGLRSKTPWLSASAQRCRGAIRWQ